MTDNGLEPVGQLLRDQAARVAAQVTPPDWQAVAIRHARRRRQRRVRVTIVAAVAALAALAAVVALLTLPGGDRHPAAVQRQRVPAYPVRFGGHVLLVRDLLAMQKQTPVISRTHVVTRRLRIKTANYASIAFGAGSAWVLAPVGGQVTSPCGKLVRVSTATAAITGSVPLRLCPAAVAYGDGSVWVLTFQIGVRGFQLDRINPATLAVTAATTIDGGPHGLTPEGDTGAKYMFVTVAGRHLLAAAQDQDGGGQVVTVDASTGQPVHNFRIPARYGPVTGLAANHHAAWAGTVNGWVMALDPATGTITSARQDGTRVISLSASDTAVWVTVNLPTPPRARYPGLDVLRLDPRTGSIADDTGLPMTFVATDGASVWALGSAPPYASDAGLAAKVNPTTGSMIEHAQLPAPLAQPPDTIGVNNGSAWVINDFLGTLTRIRP
jgi:outer membrane protein assembly factor BamB